MSGQQAGAAGAGALDLGKGLFGTTQLVPTGGTQVSNTNFRPEDLAALQQQQQGLQQSTQSFQQRAGQLANQISPAQLQQIQSAPQFGQGLDSISRSLISGEQQRLGQQATARQQAISSQLRQQPGVARALNQQIAAQSALQQNPLAFQAQQAQIGREQTQAQSNLAFQQAANQALLQQQEAQQQAAQGQAALGQAGLGAQQNLLSTIAQLAQARGTQVSDTEQRVGKERAGGLFK